MTPGTRLHLVAVSFVVLFFVGLGWGLAIPLSKLAVSTGYRPFGLIFWQLVIGAVLMTGISLLRRRRLPVGWPQFRVFLIIALIGTVFPNSASYQAVSHLPAGVISILLSLVPMISFPIALALRQDRFSYRRFFGLLAGLAGVLLLIIPETSLPERSAIWWVPVAILAGMFYAFEGNYVARWGTAGMDGFEVLFGASIVGAIVVLPLALASGQWINPLKPWDVADWALVGSSVIHVFVYASYVWLVGKSGPVFAVQASYLVTGFGVIWAMVLLNESYSPYIWAALAIMFFGLMLVQPRPRIPLAADAKTGETSAT